jgi:hypothetical protein
VTERLDTFLRRFLLVGTILLGLDAIVIAAWGTTLYGWSFVPAGLTLAALGVALVHVSWGAFRDD